jgi:selenide, water dikinase
MTDAKMTDTKLTANIKAAGCAAKISAAQLHEIVSGLPQGNVPQLLTAIASFEDAAVYKISDELAIVQTIDFFPPVVDDPFLYGQIAAVNALSDIYAMGGEPKLALSVLCFPVCDYELCVAQKIVAGGALTLQQAGAVLAGGHSIQQAEPLYGLAVTGIIHPQRILTNGGGQVGDALVLCKGLGTGALLLAHKGGVLPAEQVETLFTSMTQLNDRALAVGRKFNLHAATDVTGFGLIGHVHEMARAAHLSVRLLTAAMPLLPGAIACAEQGLLPAGAYANRESYKEIAHINDGIDLAMSDLLFDPQTSGGLLFALSEKEAQVLCEELQKQGLVGAIIGHLVEGKAGQVEVL